MRPTLTTLTLLLTFFQYAPSIRADDAGIELFERKIRPVLAEHCYQCHAVTAKKVRGGLLLDSREALRKGGESGPALISGDPDKSLLIKAIRHTDEALKMPPQKKLPQTVIADFEAWIKMGAPDPRDKATVVKKDAAWEDVVRVRRDWWSLHQVRNQGVPTVKNTAWSGHAIDRFLLAKLEEKGLAPATAADPQTLIRRLSLVLTGLPPTPAEVEQFAQEVKDAKPQAVEKLVDRLLASPHFGERWARHWMDVVRFTETHGNEWNYEVHHAWRYRDYLIRAFNDDVPYDQFVREHIAGDLLPKPRWNSGGDRLVTGPGLKDRLPTGPHGKFNESIIGPAFYRFGEVNHDDCVGLRQIGYDLLDNQIDTLSKAFQAMTVACARCHDHKLDAVSMRDYYGLLGTLRSSRCVSHTIDSPEVNADLQQKMRLKKAEIRRELAQAWLRESSPERLEKWLKTFTDDKAPLENPLAVWRRIATTVQKDKKVPLADSWKTVAAEVAREDTERTKFNQNFTMYADFRQGTWPDWQIGGQGLRGPPSKPGDLVIAPDGDSALSAILPAGCYTHTVSGKLNGTLRSPVVMTDKKRISFQVLGQHNSGVRLVSNNCQLNYTNYRALTSTQPQWITFPLPDPKDNLRPYAELMTMFDNPKFPDQLATLGGDKMDYRVPWEQAAKDPRSFFGVTQVVVHDQGSPPKPSMAHLRSIFTGPAPASLEELAGRCAKRLETALTAWMNDAASEDDVRWLEPFLQRGYFSNKANLTPGLAQLMAEYRKLDSELSLPRIVPGLADFGPGFEQPIFTRGDCFRPGPGTPRRYVEVLAPAPFSSGGSGRLELANVLASPDNPLTARVMVNRVWHHLFGTGIVRTVDDFGHVGEAPSHPELLDYLAQRFVADGWSIKKLIRAIVLTRTFQASHQPSPEDLVADPLNRLLQHYPARRLEAEAIRDSLLFASGRLDRELFGMSIPAYREKDDPYHRLFKGPLDGKGRRSIYIKVTLMEPPKFLEAFNFPGGKVSQGRRDITDVPAQALAMLNDPFVLDQADVWSKRLIQSKNDSIGDRVDAMFRQALSRDARPEERERFGRFVSQVAGLHQVPAEGILGSAIVWRDVAHTLFNLREFISVP